MKKTLLALMALLCIMGKASAQEMSWDVVEPTNGNQYYIYNLAQKKYLNDSDGWDETATTLWTFSGTISSYSLTSQNGNQFAMYRSWFTNYVKTSVTGYSGDDILLSSVRSDEGTYAPSYTIYRANKFSGGYRNVKSSESGLEIAQEAQPEFVFVSKSQYEAQARSTETGKFGTICLPKAFTPTGATIYSISSIADDGTLNLTEVTDITAGVPYIYQATADKQTFDNTGDTEATSPVDNTYLQGLFAADNIPGGNYVLQTQNGVQAFYKLAKSATGTKNRCYVKGSLTTDAKSLAISTGESTAIETLSSLASSDIKAIYTANGAKVNSLQKGLNIIKMSDNSVKKVMVK